MLPCGTPQVSGDLIDCTLSMLTDCVRFCKKDSIQERARPLTPSDYRKRSITVVSNAANRSSMNSKLTSRSAARNTSVITFSMYIYNLTIVIFLWSYHARTTVTMAVRLQVIQGATMIILRRPYRGRIVGGTAIFMTTVKVVTPKPW